MADWDEIKRLAADFQRAQLSSTIQRLSERNCVEIVQKLSEQKLIEVIYTTDGKEYLTPQELAKEIREELTVHGGRVNLVELQQAINVDFSHIESKVSEVVKSDRNLSVVLGQLIDETYLDGLGEEVNDQLQEKGQVTIAELTIAYDLPSDFVFEAVQARLGSIIHGQIDDFDRNIIFTEAFVTRFRAKIRGTFSGMTRPTPVMTIMNQFGLQERLFYSLVEDLVSCGRLAGTISGGRVDKAQYIPDIYTQSQNEWVNSFYKQNGYLEYDALTRLGIADPKSFVKKKLKGEPLIYLSTCCAGRPIEERIDAEIEEALNSKTWVDVLPSLPSIFSTSDANQVVQKCLKSKTGGVVFCDTIVASEEFIKSCTIPFESIMAVKAEKDAKTNPALLAPEGDKKSTNKVAGVDDGAAGREEKKEQRRKKASTGKSGGGTQGREVKTKSTKKKGHKGRGGDDDSDDDKPSVSGGKGKTAELEFLSTECIEEELRKIDTLNGCPEDFLSEIAETLYRPLKRQYQEVAKSVFLRFVGSETSQARKKTHGELQEKINGLWTNAKLFEKAIKYFLEDTQHQLNKHLLKTVCSDICNLVLNALATEQMMSVSEDTQITSEVRLKLLSKMSDDKTKEILTKLHTSLNNETLEEFFHQLDQICSSGHLEIVLKKPDKKKERQLIFNHRQALVEQLKNEMDPAMALHLASVLIFQIYTLAMIHAPGRCVPQVIAYLEEHLSKEHYQILAQCQDLVVKQLKRKTEELKEKASPRTEEEGAGDLTSQLHDLLPKVKEIALTARKNTSTGQDGD